LVIVKGTQSEEQGEKESETKKDIVCEENDAVTKKKKGTEIQILDMPTKIVVGESFNLRVSVTNNNDEEHEYEIYSYIYRGSKCYSKSRENNKEDIKVESSGSEIVELEDKVEKAENGKYNLKIRLKQDNLKGEKELKETIFLENLYKENENRTEKIEVLETPESENNLNSPKIQEYIKQEAGECTPFNETSFDYESSSYKSKKLIKYFILITLALITIIVVWKNE